MNIEWSKVLTGVALTLILGFLSAIYGSIQKIAEISHTVDVMTLVMKHNNEACAHRFDEAMKEVNRLHGIIEEHISEARGQ